MATYTVTTTKWTDPTFWSAISESGYGISQQFGTVVGETYSTSVDLSQNGGDPGSHTVLVEILDENGTVIDSATTVIGRGGSDTVSLDFVATTATSEIRITNPSSTATVNTDVVITNVSVTGLDPANREGNDTISGDGNTARESLNCQDLTTTDVRDDVTINTGSAGRYGWGFSEPATNVSFNIVDLDALENIQIFAYDENNNPIEVIVTPGSNVSVSDNSGDGIDDFVDGSSSVGSASNSVTVTIPGPQALQVMGPNTWREITAIFPGIK